jgi:RNA polymerase sigma factor (sigma-70 family)
VTMRMATRAGDDLAMLFGIGAVGRLSDAELLARFIRREDAAASEAAFSTLVSRHGPMVLGTCRRMLGDDHAAADAFQAVFLLLARRAPAVRVDDSLGRWLYGVSIRVARRARIVARAERLRFRALDGLDPADESASVDPRWPDDLRTVIDEEIARLPGRYRSAVVLCYLEGLTQEQAARRLRCPVGTVQSRLHRARQRLRPALVRRGLAPAAWGAAALAATTAQAEVPPVLAAAAARFAGGASAEGVALAVVALLTQSTARSLSMIQGLRVGMMLVALGLTATGAATLSGGGGDQATQPATPRGPATKPIAPTAHPEPSLAERFERIRAEYQAQLDALSRALDSEIADNYYGLMSLDKRLENLDNIIALQQQSLRFAQLAKEFARATDLPVQRFQAEVRKNQSEKLIVLQDIIQVENRINFLAGRFPQPVAREPLKLLEDFIDLSRHTLSVGVPAELLENRPDVRQAERELAAAGLDVKVARKNFYPHGLLTAGVGYEAFNPTYLLLTPEALAAQVVGNPVVPFINRKAIKADYFTANAWQLQAIYKYQRVVLNAFTEVVNRLAKVQNDRNSIEIKKQQVKALEAAVDRAMTLYQFAHPDVDYLDVLLAQRDLFEGRRVLIDTKREQLSAIVNTYQALGGGAHLSPILKPEVMQPHRWKHLWHSHASGAAEGPPGPPPAPAAPAAGGPEPVPGPAAP